MDPLSTQLCLKAEGKWCYCGVQAQELGHCVADWGKVEISVFHVMVCAQLPADRWVLCSLGQNDAVKPISLTLIKSYSSEHKIFLHQLLQGKLRGIECFIKLVCVACV